MARHNTRDSAAPTHRLMPSWKQNIALKSPAVVTRTPAERSNSPPIISMPTPTATMPIVEDWERTVKKDAGVRKAGATIRKKMKMTIAATRAPISGRARSRFDQPRVTRLDASAGAGGDGSVLTGVLLMTAPVLFGGDRVRPDRSGRTGPLEGITGCSA